jgi:hypothetical protein
MKGNRKSPLLWTLFVFSQGPPILNSAGVLGDDGLPRVSRTRGARAAPRGSLRLDNDNLCDSVEPRDVWPPAETSRLLFMRLCYKLGIAAVVLLLPGISAHSAGTRSKIDPDSVVSLMRAVAPRCAVVCGITCIRPWAPFNGTAFPMPDQGGLFECLQSGAVTPYPSDASGKPMSQPAQGRALALPPFLGDQRPNRPLRRQKPATRRTR